MSGPVRPSRRTKRAYRLCCRSALFVAALCLAVPSWGQGLTILPTLSLTETLTDNRDVQASAKRSDLITQVSPGLSITARRGAIHGSLSYSANGVAYARESSLNTVYHSLSSVGNLELLDGRAGVSASASAGRQVVSAFGVQGTDTTLNTGNQAQVYSYNLSPYLRGRLLGDVAYQVNVGYSSSRSDAAGLGDSTSLTASASLSGRIGSVGWGLDASRAVSEQADQARTHNGRFGGSLNYSPDIEVQLTLRAGSEVSDLQSGQSTRSTNWGAGASWTPGPRTSIRFDTDRRFFGRTRAMSSAAALPSASGR